MVSILQKLKCEILVIWEDYGLITSFSAKNGQKWFIWHNSGTHIRFAQIGPHFIQKVTEIIFKPNYLESLDLLGSGN